MQQNVTFVETRSKQIAKEKNYRRAGDYCHLYTGKYRKMQKLFCSNKKKELKNDDKEGNGNIITISYNIKFVYIARFMASSLSNFLNNLTEGIHKIKYKNCSQFFEYKSVKD